MKARSKIIFIFTVILQFNLILSLIVPGAALAAPEAGLTPAQQVKAVQTTADPRPALADTTLTVRILSSPYATLDSNGFGSPDTPHVFVIEAEVINNTGTPALSVNVTLDYREDLANNWRLLTGEKPVRNIPVLAGNTTVHVYWFATYSTVIGATHEYFVSAKGTNTPLVSTSTNYNLPRVDANGRQITVQTYSVIGTGNNGVFNFSASVIVGVEFIVTITYNLVEKPFNLIFSPVGNTDFQPGANRLLSTNVRFYQGRNGTGTLLESIDNRLYFSNVNQNASSAVVSFSFIPLIPANVKLCPYTSQSSDVNPAKYDKNYCVEEQGEVIHIIGELEMELTKNGDKTTALQGQDVAYTLHYANNSTTSPMQYVWIWDNVITNTASVLPGTVTPPASTVSPGQVAWNLGTVQVGASGDLQLSANINGNGSDLADGTQLINYAYFGIEQGQMATTPAMTRTFTTTVQAPAISFKKTDGLGVVKPGDHIDYHIMITNTGSVAAQNLVVRDTLSNYLSLDGTPTHDPVITGQELVWNFTTLAGNGGVIDILVPVKLDMKTPNHTALGNTATLDYQNTAGHQYSRKTTTHTSTVNAPELTISKTSDPVVVLAGNPITYTLSYENNGLASATNVVITDRVPVSTTYITDSCSGGVSCNESSGVITWVIDTLAPGDSGTVTFVVDTDVDNLKTGDVIRNFDYKIDSDQFGPLSGTAVETVVSHEAANVVGTAFEDLNGDGEKSPGEPGIPNVPVHLPGANDPDTTTDGNGNYSFRVERPGWVQVTADMPPSGNYFRTSMATVNLNVTLGVTSTVNFGYADKTTSDFGVVFGVVFDDRNHSGVQDGNEPGLANVKVESTGAIVSPLYTNGYGLYTFKYSANQSVIIKETNPTNYVSTTPDTANASVVLKTEDGSPIKFGDYLGIKIAGKVFDDQDVDGVDDGIGLAGANVTANGATITTDSTGLFVLYVSVHGVPVDVVETDPTGFTSTAAIPGSGMVRVDVNTLRIETPVSGSEYIGATFGDVKVADVVHVTGQVWDDNGAGGGALANGLKDGTEPGLPGAVVSLSSGMTQTTGANGVFSLFAPANEPITVTETNPANYVSTNAIAGSDAVKLTNDAVLVAPLPAGSTTAGNYFGDVQISSVAVITGVVYLDEDWNGVRNLGESGIAGAKVSLQFAGGISNTVFTDANGFYQFAVAPGTDIRITATQPDPTYRPTSPNSLVVRPLEAVTYPDVNFGFTDSTTTGIVYGIVFDDSNSNGVQELGELGLAGAVLALDGMTQTTKVEGLVAGTFSFSVTEEMAYSLHETNPAGYRSTTPDTVNVQVASTSQSYYIDFGDTKNDLIATIFGTAFDDKNGNGVQDLGEAGLPGVVISVTVSAPYNIITTTTKLYGQYTYGFELRETGYHTVSEQDPAKMNYHSTTPDQVNLYVVLNNSYVVDFGDSELNYSVVGTVFDDIDGDGQQDISELGIAGVNVSLSNGDNLLTKDYGQYFFPLSSVGPITVTETDKAGYHSTTPNAVPVNIVNTRKFYEVNFGDNSSTGSSSLFGTVFNDQNVDGQRQVTELGVSGVAVGLDWFDESAGLVHLLDYLTNEWGQYTFLVENTGIYTVTEDNKNGWVSINALPGSPNVTKLNEDTLLANINNLGVDYGDNLFADSELSKVAVVSGMVWEDNGDGGGVAGNGLRDGSEPGLAGDTVKLDSGMSVLTLGDGSFTLYAPPGQALKLTEVNLPGYFSTGAVAATGASIVDNDNINIPALAAEGVSTPNLFGDVLASNLEVTKSGKPTSVVAGELLTYTVQVTNHGPAAATAVEVEEELPEVGQFSYSATQGTFDTLTGLWQVGDLAVDQMATLTLWVTVDPGTVNPIVNSATGSSDLFDYDNLNDTAAVITIVTRNADLAIVKSASPEEILAGRKLTYTLSYTSAGPSNSGPVTITDLLPDGVTYGGVVSQPESVTGPDQIGQTLTWSAPSMLDGETGEIVFTATVDVDTLGWITNQANVSSQATDLNLNNNTSTARTNVLTPTSIYGTVYNDVNGNGKKDFGETGLGGVTVTLDGKTTTTTAPDGTYGFIADAGVHKVVETNPEDYFSTTPDEVHVLVVGQNRYQVNFGDAASNSNFASVFGTVFDDTNQNSVWDAEETGLEGVTVSLDDVGKTTDVYGSYSFLTTAGTHKVVETDLPGYISTTPNEVNLLTVVGFGFQADFGDTLQLTCTVDNYEEDDVLTEAKQLQIGKVNSQVHNFCDDSTDWYAFTVKAGDLYTITTSSWDQRADTNVVLYGTDGLTFLAGNDDFEDTTDYSSSYAWKAPLDGTYYLKVTNRASLTGSHTGYDIWIDHKAGPVMFFLPILTQQFQAQAPSSTMPAVSEVPLGVINHFCPDTFEVDDSWMQARAILPDVEQLHSFDSNPMLYAADKDVVKFDLNKGDQVIFTVEPINDTPTVMELMDSTGTELGITGTVRLDWKATADGQYFLSVLPGSLTFGCSDVAGYNLLLTFKRQVQIFLPTLFQGFMQ